MKFLNYLLLFMFIITNTFEIFANPILEKLTPKPRQAYIREQYSAVFTITQNTKIYINPDNPQSKQAEKLKTKLAELFLLSLEIKYWTEEDTASNGIFMGVADDWLNRLLSKVPDQKLRVTKDYPGSEGYVIDIIGAKALLIGSDEQGLSHSVETFLQLIQFNETNFDIFFCRVIDAPQFPVRWLHYMTNVYVPANIIDAKKIWSEAASYKFNGVNINDVKFSFISNYLNDKRYVDSLKSLKKFADDNFLLLIPGIFPFGYSGPLMFYDPNLASGLPVIGQKFVIEGDTGRLVPHKDVTLANGGFEIYSGNNFPGFTNIDSPGEKSFVDTVVFHSGKASIRFDNLAEFYAKKDGNHRIFKKLAVKPFSYYHYSGWFKTENLQWDWFPQSEVLGKDGKRISFVELNISEQTNEWTKIDVCFNSLVYDTVSIIWGVWGGRRGKIWWDDLFIEEVPFVNLIRRAGAPISVSHPILDIAYIEGRDYDSLYDPKTGRKYSWYGDFDTYHTPPTFRIRKGGNIHNGDTVLISYYHAVVIYDGQVMVTMSEPKLYESIEREFKSLDSLIKPDIYFMQHDEIRTMNWDFGDQVRGLKPAEILADNVNKCVNIIKKYNPNADIWIWSDMFDEHHNALPADYYLVNGDLTGSADLIPNSIGIGNWNTGNGFRLADSSLRFFSGKGFRQIAASFYDLDQRQIKKWKDVSRLTPQYLGQIYTTWGHNFNYIKHFGEYLWNNAPYIYHNPPSINIIPKGNFQINFTFTGDKWDPAWKLDTLICYYRTKPSEVFSEIPVNAIPDVENIIEFKLADDNQWLQYFFIARDYKGWTTRIPFGEEQYFEFGKIPVNAENDLLTPISYLSIFPNPVAIDEQINLEIFSYKVITANIEIIDVLGRRLINKNDIILKAGINRIALNVSELIEGVYFIRIENYQLPYGKFILLK